ncbi:hypothetical protein [Sphingopyxis sp.]|uniref:hypothetical protein n=1 Tax=Sphingopyxis sp. TaxID=1908224 RepID=UPI0035AF1057
MPGTRNRLINAARRSMLQRAELHRKLDAAQAALRPKALVARGKYRLGETIDDAAHVVRQEFRDNRLPIALAAVAGTLWIFREPIKEHAPKLAQKAQDLAEAAIEKFRPDTAEQDGKEDDEAAE